ncbi:MAG: pyridoxamine 5'-phosphate oxidase family protein [Candidatus Heteroscillospira sp.]
MIRKDRERDASFALEVLRQAPYATLSLVTDGDEPYGIPVSPVVTDNGIYFHCALEGKKLDCIRAHPTVSLSAVSRLRTIGEEYTLSYDSAVASGRAEIVEDTEEKRAALYAICLRYTPEYMDRFESAARAVNKTCIVRIIPDKLTGKQNPR